MEELKINCDRLWSTLDRLGEIGKTGRGGVTRLALSDEDKRARDLLVEWMKEIGLRVGIDDVGNIYGWRDGRNEGADPVVFGSHLDTVAAGGRFDGALGIAAALEVMRVINENGRRTGRPLVMVDWTNEEGARFAPAMLGSGLVSGQIDRDYAYTRKDSDGRMFVEELERIGYRGEEAERLRRIGSYVELHIEQGRILEDLGMDVGIVEGVQGIRWYKCLIEGESGHAGTVPMNERRDALVAAARYIEEVATLGSVFEGEVTATVGWLSVEPGAVNVIPGKVEFTVDVRAETRELLERAEAALLEKVERLRGAGFKVRLEEMWRSEPVSFSQQVLSVIESVIRIQGKRGLRMLSRAGHDACHMAKMGPTGMIFVPCRGGKSHCEEEEVSREAACIGAQVLLDVVLELADRW